MTNPNQRQKFFQPSLDNIDIRQDASLEDFVGECYQPLLNAVHQLCSGQMTELFVVGKKGFGKTHLAMAIYDEYTNQGLEGIYISFAELVMGEEDEHALSGLEHFDLVILDDVGAISGNDYWQEALFHLINRVRNQQKQLLFLADNPAGELHITLLDLVTRLSLAPMIDLPVIEDLIDRSALINHMLQRKNWRLPDEILAHLITEGPQNSGDIAIVLENIAPLLTHLSRVQVPKKIIEKARQVIERETLLLELSDYVFDDDLLDS